MTTITYILIGTILLISVLYTLSLLSIFPAKETCDACPTCKEGDACPTCDVCPTDYDKYKDFYDDYRYEPIDGKCLTCLDVPWGQCQQSCDGVRYPLTGTPFQSKNQCEDNNQGKKPKFCLRSDYGNI